MLNPPLISVIIPTYNRAIKVGSAIESVLRQTYTNFQLIVADDGSVDNTAEIIKAYPQAQYLQLKHGGQAWARNQGFLHANGQYIASLDSDDIWEDCFLEKCLGLLENTDADFVFANWMQETGNKIFFDRFSICSVLKNILEQSQEQCIVLDNQILRKLYLTGCASPSSSLIIKRSSLSTQWNSELNIADDWCLLMDMIYNKPCKAALTKEILWSKKLDGQNIYDGRNTADVIAKLWVYDMSLLYIRFRKLWTKEEEKTFRKRQTNYLVLHSYYQLRFYKQFKKSFFALEKAFNMNATEVVSILSRRIMKACTFSKQHF